MEENALHDLSAALEEIIWSLPEDQLTAAEPALRAFVTALGAKLTDLLAPMADESLAVAVQKNFLRKPAFEEWLVNRYEQPLLHWFHQRCGSWERAQDLTQELYVKLWTTSALAHYDPNRAFYPWLWTVARNLLVGDWRRRRRTEVALPEQEQLSLEAPPPEEAAGREMEGRIESAVRDLPDAQQRILRGAMNGLSAEEIGRDLGLARVRVFQLLFKARCAVKAALGLNTGPARDREGKGQPREG